MGDNDRAWEQRGDWTQDPIPRGPGLEHVMNGLFSDHHMLRGLAKTQGPYLMSALHVLGLFHRPGDKVTSGLEQYQASFADPACPSSYRSSLSYLAQGKDYLDLDPQEAKEMFYAGSQRLQLATPQGLDTSFEVVVYPSETIGIPEKIQRAIDDKIHHAVVPHRHTLVKSLLLTNKKKQDGAYLFVLPEQCELEKTAGAQALELSNSQYKKSIRPVAEGELTVTIGKVRGSVSPLIHPDFWDNVEKIFIDQSLEVEYTGPMYELVVDKRSAIAVDSLAHATRMMSKAAGKPYPPTHFVPLT